MHTPTRTPTQAQQAQTHNKHHKKHKQTYKNMATVKTTSKTNASKAEKTVNKKRNREEEPQGAADDTLPVEKKSKSETIQDLQDCIPRFSELLAEENMRYNNLQREYEKVQQEMEDLERDVDGVYGGKGNDDEAVYNEKQLEITRRKDALVTSMGGCLMVIERLQKTHDDFLKDYDDARKKQREDKKKVKEPKLTYSPGFNGTGSEGFEGGVFLSEAEIDAIDRRQRQEFNDVLRANYEVWKKKNTESNGPEATGSTTKE